MNRFALLSLYRSLTRHKLYAALNIGGLAVGIAVFLVLGLYVRFETSFEKWLPDHDKIYVVQTVWNLPGSPFNGRYSDTMGGLLEQLQEDFPGTVGTRIWGGEGAGSVLRRGVATKEDVAEVDPSFFDVFDLPMVSGDGRRALADPSGAIISESLAHKYFGTSDPIGQTITASYQGPQTYRIGGVFRDLPANSDMKVSLLLPLIKGVERDNWFHWGSTHLTTYLRFDTVGAARAYAQKLPAFVDRRALKDSGPNASKTEALALLPLTEQHLASPTGSVSSKKLTVVTLGLVGVLTLLIAIVNYVNLATARAGLRAREVAMRKVLGASRKALVTQFLGEAMLMVGIAALGGLILAELGLPLVNAAGGLSLTIPYMVVVPALAVLVVVVGALAGFYPALLLSRVPAAAVLASSRSPGGGRAGTRVREALVVFQFGMAIAFMIGTAILLVQTRHVRQADLGYQRDGLIILRSIADGNVAPAQRRAMVEAIRALPGVQRVALGGDGPGGSGTTNADNVALPGLPGEGPNLQWVDTGPGFFQVYGARLIAGRMFDPARREDDHQMMDAAKNHNIIINRLGVKQLRFASPDAAIGKVVGGNRPRTIIGVVDNLRFDTPRNPIAPTYFYFSGDPAKNYPMIAAIRYTGDPRTMLASIRSVWQRMVPQVPFQGDTADNRLARYYKADEQATRLFAIGAGLAVLIGCVGLWGLASFNTARRVREIGIRKTLGASATDIVRLLVGQFLRPVLLANLIAWPLAFVAMRTWLAGFEDRVALSPLFFVGASLVAMLIAVLTVLGQSLRASRAAPAWALRHD
ncbi:putative ABC transport system permease protein [Sphingomonas sp. SORGH_AS802]|uniref:ABC transporter permease n=1 Tax=unclassified Sphingomonas TaxID=196159 RepID=UPI0028546D99|nr:MULTISPECIES: ABC transporter permease [unclassified Sphingomonas]MDR6128741.1 putative ABC transport system permease protein [Sphingomonas sp. SORGH_AS_0438]MDR6135065.1 putative ABC transport system permease protein [Sphingomonas sp. SORGH_AS_0802]